MPSHPPAPAPAGDPAFDLLELLSGELDLTEVLKRACDAALAGSVCERASIYLYDPDRGTFRSVMSRGLRDPALFDQFLSLPVATMDDMPAYRIAMGERRPVVIDDATTSPLLRRIGVELFGLKTVVIYPLLAGRESVGVLFLDTYTAPARISAEEVTRVSAIAGPAALVIRQAQLDQTSARYRRQLEALHEVTSAITSAQEPGQLLALVARRAGELIGARSARIELLDGPGQRVVAAVFGESTGEPGTTKPALSGLGGFVLAHRRGVLLRNKSEGIAEPAEAAAAVSDRNRHESAVLVPLQLADGTLLGLLAGNHPDPYRFGPEHLILLERLAVPAAAAIDRARMADRERVETDRLRQLLRAVEQVGDGVAMTAQDRRTYTYVNAAFARMHGYQPAEMVGRMMDDLQPAPTDGLECLRLVDRAGMEGSARGPLVRYRRDGTAFCVDMTATRVADADERAGIVISLHDMTERRQLEDQLRHQAFHDPLTGLANRAELTSALQAQLSTGAGSFALLFCDLDRFKAVNDGLGHAVGDTVLVQVARRLHGVVRDGDLIARLGGDEFAALVPAVNPEQAVAYAQRLIGCLAEPISVGGRNVHLGMSIGVALGTGAEDADALLAAADAAMYRAKAAGGGWQLHLPDDAERALRELELEEELRTALEREQLVAYYEPMVTLPAGRVQGFEALLRWRHPARGLLVEADFLALAERAGLAGALTQRLLRTSCREAAGWRGSTARVAVQLPDVVLGHSPVAEQVQDALEQSGLDPARLVLEVTETALLALDTEASQQLRALGQLGVGLAIDDFGAGFASLGHLERYSFDAVRMDASFSAGLGVSRASTEVLTAVLSLAGRLHLTCVAQGVDTAAQASQLAALGCPWGQGPLFSPALAPADVAPFLAA